MDSYRSRFTDGTAEIKRLRDLVIFLCDYNTDGLLHSSGSV